MGSANDEGGQGSSGSDTRVKPGRVAILGYGDDARAQSLALRAAGFQVTVSVRPGGMSWVRAIEDGVRPAPAPQAVFEADVVVLHIPDAELPVLYASLVAPFIRPGTLLVFGRATPMFARALEPATDLDVVLVRAIADKNGHAGAAVAVNNDATGSACERALAYARTACGGASRSVATTTFAEATAAELWAMAKRTGGVAELLADWEAQRKRAESHEPDNGRLDYYERLSSALAESGVLPTTSRRGVA